MEGARTRSCIAVVDIGVDPAGRRIRFGPQQPEIGLGVTDRNCEKSLV